MEGRILELEHKIKSAKIIADKGEGKMGKEVNMGTHVTIRNNADEEEFSYTIVGATEADPFEKRISNESPIGKALLGKVRGETVKVHTPAGIEEYEVLLKVIEEYYRF